MHTLPREGVVLYSLAEKTVIPLPKEVSAATENETRISHGVEVVSSLTVFYEIRENFAQIFGKRYNENRTKTHLKWVPKSKFNAFKGNSSKEQDIGFELTLKKDSLQAKASS